MSFDTVRLDVQDAVATITLNRPQALNALNLALARDLTQALLEVDRPEVRVVVVGGSDQAFCAGADLKDIRAQDEVARYLRQLTLDLHEAVAQIKALPQPVIASVGGVAAGGGFGLMLACDLAIAAENARFTPAFIKLGLSPDCSTTYHLVRLLGEKRAFELAAFSPMLSAQDALDRGLINKVVAADALEAETTAWARSLAQSAPLGLKRTKRLIQQGLDRPLHDQLEAESLAIVAGARSQDFQEGVEAFLEKRPPKFSGR